MARTTLCKNNMVTDYIARISVQALYAADPGTTGTGEIAGGSPAYARVAPTAGTVSGGSGSMTALFNVESGDTVGGAGNIDSSGNLLEGGPLTPVTFTGQGKYQLTTNISG